jgi:predicted nucleotide-binding protein
MPGLRERLERFTGPDGVRRLAEVFGDQELVRSETTLAERFASTATVAALKRRGSLYLQGHAGNNSLYFLLSGSLDLLANGVHIRTLRPGEMVGEFPIVDPALPYAVTIRAAEDSIVAAVPESEVLRIAQEHPDVWRNMARLLVHRLYDTTRRIPPHKAPCVFIGHGHSSLWRDVDSYIANELHVKTINYERAGHAGEATDKILRNMLDQATFAVLVLTAEDETAEARMRARQNVVHEAGLFQGVLGFERAIMLVQSEVESFSNVAGLRGIRFDSSNIAETFAELRRSLEAQGVIQGRRAKRDPSSQ